MAGNKEFLQLLSPTDFKAYFFRDFTYIDDWVDTTNYITGDTVFYTVDNKVYRALQDNVNSTPSTTANWEVTTNKASLVNLDITTAYAEALGNMNYNLFRDQENLKITYLYLVAHYITITLQSLGALDQGSKVITGQSVSSVSQSFRNNDNFVNSEFFNFINQTRYGQRFLQMYIPRLRTRRIGVVGGSTSA